jgi:protein gp37
MKSELLSGGERTMSTNSSIEWTESTWNPVTGCTKVSPGCKHCYAERMALRLQAMGQPNYVNGFKLTLHEHALELPLSWKKPRMIFVNSMSDLFHHDVPLEFIQKVLRVMHCASWHTFQVLTKRSERLLELNPEIDWPSNVWMGVSVENKDYTFRIDHLRQTDAHVRFLSLEPLLGPLPNLDLHEIHWVIVGGESGPGARALKKEWVVDIRDQCLAAQVPFFFKQWGGFNKKQAGRILEGRTWDEKPGIAAQMPHGSRQTAIAALRA